MCNNIPIAQRPCPYVRNAKTMLIGAFLNFSPIADIGMLRKCARWMSRSLGVHVLVPEYPGKPRRVVAAPQACLPRSAMQLSQFPRLRWAWAWGASLGGAVFGTAIDCAGVEAVDAWRTPPVLARVRFDSATFGVESCVRDWGP